jgi:hypothetical protein
VEVRRGVDGRITLQSARELARPYTAEAITTLVEIMRNPAAPIPERRGAANDLLSRAWGKPKETVEITENPENETRAALAGLSGDELRDLLRALRGPLTVDGQGRAVLAPERATEGPRGPAGARSGVDPAGDTSASPIAALPAPRAGGESTTPPPAGADGGADVRADGEAG